MFSWLHSKVAEIISIKLKQWFSTVALKGAKGAKSRLTTLLESGAKEIVTKVTTNVLLYSRTKSLTQNIRGFIERLQRATQKVLGVGMPFSEQWLRTTERKFFSFQCFTLSISVKSKVKDEISIPQPSVPGGGTWEIDFPQPAW